MHPSAVLETLLLQFYAALTDGDLAMLEKLVAADALAIGTDPGEWLTLRASASALRLTPELTPGRGRRRRARRRPDQWPARCPERSLPPR